jgi:hypothetical protein
MKCIDAIEGTAKYIIKELHTTHIQNGVSADDSQYIYNVKMVISASDLYVRDHPELIEDPEILKQVLYEYARNLWLMGPEPVKTHSDSTTGLVESENEEYQTYYYDYIYNRGVYPG